MYWRVKVRPRARKTEIESIEGKEIVASVKAAPEKGKANAELVSMLASEFGVAKSEVVIVSGMSSRVKLVRIDQ
jgi:uncharacterized protein